jgi:YegS/Rv2252/BmrU family lipid kinase
MNRSVCIYNPAARNAPGQPQIDALRTRLAHHGYDVDFQATQRPLHATELARKAVAAAVDLVIACGGDGTIREVAEGLALSNVPLAILPSGTANVLARELGLPQNPLKAVEWIPKLKPHRIALGNCAGNYFVLMAGAGVDAATIELVDPQLKSRFGVLAYWWAALRFWTRGNLAPVSVRVDDEQAICTFAVTSRVSRYGGSYRITRNANLLSDHFEVCLFHGRSRFAYLRYFVGVLSGTHHRFRDVTCVFGKEVDISSDERIGIQVDGELHGFAPAKVTIVPDALTLLVPERYASRN